MIWFGRDGWPVEFTKNRPVLNLTRWLLHVSVVKSVFWRRLWVRVDGGLRQVGHHEQTSNVESCCQVQGREDT